MKARFGKSIYISMTHVLNMGSFIDVVTVSSKYQVVIPQDVREKMNLKPGQKLIVIEKDGVVHLIPEKPVKELRGFVKGATTGKLRHEEDRL
jgi:AbrB family looped-hinge helix DNA binding protein